jgi:hypothetical protein
MDSRVTRDLLDHLVQSDLMERQVHFLDLRDRLDLQDLLDHPEHLDRLELLVVWDPGVCRVFKESRVIRETRVRREIEVFREFLEQLDLRLEWLDLREIRVMLDLRDPRVIRDSKVLLELLGRRD